MKALHTPGPWLIRKGDEWTNDVATDDLPMPDGTPSYWNIATANRMRDEVEANTRLIAAAPDLLAIAQELEESAGYWSEYDVPLGIVDRLRAAIKKATE